MDLKAVGLELDWGSFLNNFFLTEKKKKKIKMFPRNPKRPPILPLQNSVLLTDIQLLWAEQSDVYVKPITSCYFVK